MSGTLKVVQKTMRNIMVIMALKSKLPLSARNTLNGQTHSNNLLAVAYGFLMISGGMEVNFT